MRTVSVILPNYNYGKYISSRIDEIINQTYPISELIILDDASTDGSTEVINKKIKEIAKTHPDLVIKTRNNKMNSGNVFSQWQKGIKLATSDYIWIAEADDVSKPTFLETAMSGFNHERVVLSYTNSRFIGVTGSIVLKDTLRKVKDSFRKNLMVYNIIPNVSAAVFKNQPKLIDFLEEAKKFKLSGDWFFYIKVSETGAISYSKRALNVHRLHKSSVTSSTGFEKRLSEMKKIHKYIIDNIDVSPEVKEKMQKMEEKLRKKWIVENSKNKMSA